MTNASPSILIYVGMDLVGDALMKLPFVRAVRQNWPNAEIIWLAGKGKSAFSGNLAPLVTGLIDQVVDDHAIGATWQELFAKPLQGSPLENRTFDIILDTQRRFLTTLILKRIPHKTFVSGCGGFFLSDQKPIDTKSKPRSMVEAMMQLIEAYGGTIPETMDGLKLDGLYEEAAAGLLPDGKKYIGLAPGAGGKHKCWPLEKYLALADLIADKGATPVILLGPGETEWIERVKTFCPRALLPLQTEKANTLSGSPLLTIALGKRLKAAVANDAGVGHMMAASDTPLISLFGPTPPEKFAPFVKQGAVIKAQDFGGSAEMNNIPVDQVMSAVAAFLD